MKKDKKIKKLFNLIAPNYSFFKNISVGKTNIKLAEKKLISKISLDNFSVLDIGCGTGDWSYVFKKNGADVTGIDFAEKMIVNAKKIYGDSINFKVGNADYLQNFGASSFDIVTAGFVLHGMKKRSRINLLNQMKRISRKNVVLFDFGGKIPFIPYILELLEGSEYDDYIKSFDNEFEEVFKNSEKINLKRGTALYFGIL